MDLWEPTELRTTELHLYDPFCQSTIIHIQLIDLLCIYGTLLTRTQLLLPICSVNFVTKHCRRPLYHSLLPLPHSGFHDTMTINRSTVTSYATMCGRQSISKCSRSTSGDGCDLRRLHVAGIRTTSGCASIRTNIRASTMTSRCRDGCCSVQRRQAGAPSRKSLTDDR